MLVVDAIETGRGPEGISPDQKRARVYAAASEDDTIEVYDAFSRELLGRI